MALTKNGNRIGMAAHADRVENMRYIEELQDTEAKRAHDHVMDVCQKIADILGTEAYREWWNSTPDANFTQAAESKLAELEAEQIDEHDECTCDPRNPDAPACLYCRAQEKEMPF